MKNYNYISVFLMCILFVSLEGFAQQTDQNTYLINQYFQSNKEAALTTEKKVPTVNNIANINVVDLNQVGNKNTIDIKASGNDAQGVSQIGNNNYYQFINYYNSNPSNFNILQQGNSNSLQIYGENSIINNISILQNSNFKTLIIKNY